LGKTSGVELS
jgi:hypothetical protein